MVPSLNPLAKPSLLNVISGGSSFITPQFQLFKAFFSSQGIGFDKTIMVSAEEKAFPGIIFPASA